MDNQTRFSQRLSLVFYALVLGVMATAMLDLWNLSKHYLLDTPLNNYANIGRWALHMLDGTFVHDSIKASAAKPYEGAVGWFGHYAIGVAFAFWLLAGWGLKWLNKPTLMPAMIVGVATVAIPFLLMYPGMGMGLFGLNAANPPAVIMKAMTSHIVFGITLYLAGLVVYKIKGTIL